MNIRIFERTDLSLQSKRYVYTIKYLSTKFFHLLQKLLFKILNTLQVGLIIIKRNRLAADSCQKNSHNAWPARNYQWLIRFLFCTPRFYQFCPRALQAVIGFLSKRKVFTNYWQFCRFPATLLETGEPLIIAVIYYTEKPLSRAVYQRRNRFE